MRIRTNTLLITCLLSLLTACAGTPKSPWLETPKDRLVREKSITALGTRFVVRIWLDAKDRRSPESLMRAATAEIARVARITDADDPKSELARLNRLAATAPFKVSADLAWLLALSQQLNIRSGGVFDVTFAPLQETIEKAGPDAGLNGSDLELTPDEGTSKVKGLVGQKNWAFNAAEKKVSFLKPGIKLVVKGIAKGYAAQRAAEKLRALRLRGFAVIAGNTFVAGGAALSDPHLMCVEDFVHLGRCLYHVTAIDPEQLFVLSMSASGDRPGHTYNPKSGNRTYLSGGAAVTATDAAWAQGAATSASIMELDRFKDFFSKSAQPLLSAIWFSEFSDEGIQGTLEPYGKVSIDQ